MGLDVHVEDYDSLEYMSEYLGSYSGYNMWRRSIAKANGFNLDHMDGFGGEISWEEKPFQLILNHSDFDGGYTLFEIPELLKELNEIKKLNVDDHGQTNKLLKLCEHALKTKNDILFD